MIFSEVNWLAVVVASLVQFFVGAIWFGPKTFYPIWFKALGKQMPTERTTKISGMNAGLVFLMTYIMQFIQATTLAVFVVLAVHYDASFGALGGFLAGALLGFGIGAAPALGHRLFADQGMKVWILEVGADIVALSLGGLIIGAWL